MSDIQIIHGDCLDVMAGIEAGSIDAIVTDPPYNVGFDYHEHDDRMKDYAAWCATWFAECLRVCAGPITITCGHRNVAMWHRIAPPDWIVCWWKPACMGNSPLGVNNWEPILLYGKPYDRKSVDVIRAPVKVRKDTGDHPCPKPLEWAADQVKALSRPGMTVLDPFAGSGSTPVACLKSGRRCIAIEKDSRYIPIIERRVKNAETPLFKGVS